MEQLTTCRRARVVGEILSGNRASSSSAIDTFFLEFAALTNPNRDLTARPGATVVRRDVTLLPLLIGPCKDIDYRGEMR